MEHKTFMLYIRTFTMKKINFLISSIIIFLLSTSSAYAYLDPGSASLIIQTILAFIAGLIVTAKMWYYQTINFVKKLLKKKEKID